MNPDDLPRSRMDGDDEQLSAYLDGELPGEQVAALEARLQDEPGLTRRLDAMADTLVALRRLDAVAPPPGFAARLDARLDSADGDAEQPETPLGAAAKAATGAAAASVPPDAAGSDDELGRRRARRAQRTRTTRAWVGWSGAAAALVAVAVVFAGGLGRGGLGGEDTAEMALDSGDGGGAPAVLAPQADSDAGGREEGGAQDHTGGDAAALQAPAGESAPGAATEAGQPDITEEGAYEDGAFTRAAPAVVPLLVDAGLEVADQAELETVYADLPEAAALLGTSRTEAEELVEAALGAIRDAGTFPGSGLSPGDCLDTLSSAGAGPVVPVRAEAVEFGGEPAVAYVVVRASPGASALDQVEARVVSPLRCTTVAQALLPTRPLNP